MEKGKKGTNKEETYTHIQRERAGQRKEKSEPGSRVSATEFGTGKRPARGHCYPTIQSPAASSPGTFQQHRFDQPSGLSLSDRSTAAPQSHRRPGNDCPSSRVQLKRGSRTVAKDTRARRPGSFQVHPEAGGRLARVLRCFPRPPLAAILCHPCRVAWRARARFRKRRGETAGKKRNETLAVSRPRETGRAERAPPR